MFLQRMEVFEDMSKNFTAKKGKVKFFDIRKKMGMGSEKLEIVEKKTASRIGICFFWVY